MALIQKTDIRRSYLIFGLLFLVALGGIVYFVAARKQPALTNQQTTSITGTDLPIVNKFGEEVYEQEDFKVLKNFLEEPSEIPPVNINAESEGNPNPFRAP